MTTKQEKALNHSSEKKVIYEKTENGETTLMKAKVNGEPHFIKLYYDTFLAFNQIKDVPAEFLAQLGAVMQYVGRDIEQQDVSKCIVYLGDVTKQSIANSMGVSLITVKRYIDRCKHSGILLPMEVGGKVKRGYYYTNPHLIAKGEWEGVKKLRGNIDFINNKWTVEMEIDTQDIGNAPERTELPF